MSNVSRAISVNSDLYLCVLTPGGQ